MSDSHAPDVAPISVVAVVQVNKSEALVLNRPLQFRYRKEGNDYIGRDGPFLDVLIYQRGGGRFKAFAGREITLAMEDGSSVTVKDHWWHSIRKGYISASTADVASLRKCYVFCGGACIAPDDLKALRETYTGCVYQYWDYEKVIKYDEMRSDLHRRWFHEEDRRKALEKAIKAKDAELQEAIAERDGFKNDAYCWRRHLQFKDSGGSHTHRCIRCGHSYTPVPTESEDCPVCGCDGTEERRTQEVVRG
jgi:hypothetical protein